MKLEGLELCVCQVCGKEFTKNSNLTRHLRTCDAAYFANSEHACDSCGKRFKSANAVAAHQRQVHKPPPNCADTVPLASSVPMPMGSKLFPMTCAHSVCVFVPSRGDEAASQKDKDEGASQVERNCFACVLLSLSALSGNGDARAITVIVPKSIHASEFLQASQELRCSDVWKILVDADSIRTFSDLNELHAAFREAAERSAAYRAVQSQCLHSLTTTFVVSHGDSERIKVGYGDKYNASGSKLRKAAYLMVTVLGELLDACNTDVAHIMTCKASRLIRTLFEKAKANPSRNAHTLFVAYGSEDNTTVPLEFSTGSHSLHANLTSHCLLR